MVVFFYTKIYKLRFNLWFQKMTLLGNTPKNEHFKNKHHKRRLHPIVFLLSDPVYNPMALLYGDSAICRYYDGTCR